MVGTVTTATIVLGVATFLLLIGVLALARAQRATRARAEAAEKAAEAATEELEAVKAKLTEVEIEAGRASTRADTEAARAERAEAEAAAERTRAEQAEEANARLTDALREAELEARAAQIDPAALGALEAVRISRVWQEVAGPDEPPPTGTARDDVEAAVGVLAEASREASGIIVDVDWKRDGPTPAGLAVVLVRLVEELIAAAREADRATVEIADDDDAVTVRLHTEPPTPLPEVLAAALAGTGWVVSSEPGEVVLRIAGRPADR
jgi:Tfp pilus assembly protein PilV